MKNEDVVVKQNCHSRRFLSGIPTLDTQSGGDLRLQFSGMTLNFKEEALNKNAFRDPLRSGFTLIELLVVVLIIGILAAVALPQYQLAVEKSRLTAALTKIASLQKAMDLHMLEGGGTGSVHFLGSDANGIAEFNSVVCDVDIALFSKPLCRDNDFAYRATCGAEEDCTIWTARCPNGQCAIDGSNVEYFLVTEKIYTADNKWNTSCIALSNMGQKICDNLPL